jgi:hypothetical protein
LPPKRTAGNAFEANRKTNEKSKAVTENEPGLDEPTTTTIQALLMRGATVNTHSRRRRSTKNTFYPPLDDAVLRTRNVEGLAMLEGPHPNFFRLVFGYIDADFSTKDSFLSVFKIYTIF